MKREANVSERTRKVVVTAMMIAIMEILSFTPLGMLIIPPISATTAHVPVIIAALLEGPVSGVCVGLALGLTSIFRAMSSPNFLDLLFLNPLVSVLPRILIPLTAYFTYKILKGVLGGLFAKGGLVATFLAGCVGSMTNTIGCMGMIYLIYAQKVLENTGEAAGTVLGGIIITYGIVEMLVAAFITAVVTPVIRKIFYK